MSFSETILDAISQPFFPVRIGFFDYPIFGMWFLVVWAFLLQKAGPTPRTAKQKRWRLITNMLLALVVIYGLTKAVFYVLETMEVL